MKGCGPRAAKEQLITEGGTETAFETVGDIPGLVFHHDPLSNDGYVYALARGEGCVSELLEDFSSS